jgi:hypothetical protein
MIRRMFNVACAGSLALCVPMVGLWVASYWRADGIAYVWHNQTGIREQVLVASSQRGSIWIKHELKERSRMLRGPIFAQAPGFSSFSMAASDEYTIVNQPLYGHDVLGFRYARQRLAIPAGPSWLNRSSRHGVVVPDWFFVMLLAALPASWLVLKCREIRRKRAGLCVHCGYDLRATPVRCPECGRGKVCPVPKNVKEARPCSGESRVGSASFFSL